MNKLEIKLPFNVLYKSNNYKDPQRAYLFLHGYLENAEYSHFKFKEVFKDKEVYFLQAPFPVPFERKGKKSLGYSWYIYDSKNENYVIPYDISVHYIQEFINKEIGNDKKITVVGYSQGGYLAPQLAFENSQIDRIITLAARHKPHNYIVTKNSKNIDLINIHGKEDIIVDYKESFEDFSMFSKHFKSAEFISLEDTHHRINDAFYQTLKRLL